MIKADINSFYKKEAINQEKEKLKSITVRPTKEINAWLSSIGAAQIKDGIKAYQFLKRTEITFDILAEKGYADKQLPIDIKDQIELQIKYEGYIEKALQQVERMKKWMKKDSQMVGL